MKRLVTVAVLLSASLATAVAAQSVGELFPATNTRYGPAMGIPRLTTNGRDFYLFWTADRKTRATRIDGEARGGNVVFDRSGACDVAWTGERFLAVSSRFDGGPDTSTVVGRFLDANAQPIAAEFWLVQGTIPRLAAGADSVLLVYRGVAGDLRSLRLGPDGQSIGAASRAIAPEASSFAVASSDAGFMVVLTTAGGIRAVTLDRQGQTVADGLLPEPSNIYRQVAVASDGTKYLAVWKDTQKLTSARIDQNATFDAPLTIDSAIGSDVPAVVWNGVGWSLIYHVLISPGFAARVVRLDGSAHQILDREESAQGAGLMSLAALDGRIMAAWSAGYPTTGGASVVELPLATHQPRVATYTATEQRILATASSSEGTLIVWSENSDDRYSIRIGVRTSGGGWSERELTTRENGVFRALAASDGHNFAVVLVDSRGLKFMRIDAGGRPFAALPLPGQVAPVLMAWNGTHYALIGSWDGALQGLLLSASGLQAASVAIPGVRFSASALASDGRGGFLLAGEERDCQFEMCFPVAVRGIRLDAGLQRIDADDLVFSDRPAYLAGAVWNGSEYAVMWQPETSAAASLTNGLARVPVSPSEPITITTTAAPLLVSSLAAMGNGSLAVIGRVDPGPWPRPADVTRIALLRNDGSLVGSFDLEDAENLNGAPRVTALPGGGAAYIAASVQDAAPHHGRSHVMMAIAKPSLVPPRPEPPYATARVESGNIVVDWTAPAGALNGFRVEYRIDDGAWNEIDEWFPTGAHHTAIPRPSFGTNFAVRVRAFNDGGASAYSATASTQPGRRRAVR